MANVAFKKGLLANLPATYAEGTFYVTTDERAIYLDVDGSTRIRLGDFQEFATLAALEANTNPSTTALYYISELNVLAKWDGSKYVQINLDTGATSFEVVGTGNAITTVSYDAATRKLTLTKGETFATKAELDALDTFVGDIPEGYTETTIIAYINKKAEETLNAASGGSSESAASVLAALNTYKADNDARVLAAEGEIDELQKDTHTHENAEVLNGITAEKVAEWDAKQAAGDYATKEEAQGYADAKDEAIAAAKKAGDDAQADVDALSEKVGTVADGKTVVQMIEEAQTAATYDDTQVKADIAANAEAIQTEKERMDAFMTLEDGQTLNAALDSLKEIQDFITNEAADADVLLGKVSALEAIVAGIGGEGEPATVVAYVTAAIEALKIGDYAKAADLTALAERVAAMEAKVSNWDAAEQNAKDYADGLNTAMDTRVKALEGIDHDAYVAADAEVLADAKEYADGLAGNYDEAGSADQALTDAKAYADGLAENYDEAGAAAQALTDAKAYADTAETDAVSTANAYTDAALSWGSF